MEVTDPEVTTKKVGPAVGVPDSQEAAVEVHILVVEVTNPQLTTAEVCLAVEGPDSINPKKVKESPMEEIPENR